MGTSKRVEIEGRRERGGEGMRDEGWVVVTVVDFDV